MYEFFNRVRIVLIAILLIFLISGFLVFPGGVIHLAEQIKDLESNTRVILAVIAVIVDVILFVVIFQEIRARPLTSQGFMVRSRVANVEVTLDSVRGNIDTQIAKLDDIFAVKSDIKAEQGRVSVEMDVDADENINIPRKTSAIQREVKKIIERQMGLKVGPKPVIRFRLMSEPVSIKAPATPPSEKKSGFKSPFNREKSQPDATPPAPTPSTPAAPPRSTETEPDDPYLIGSMNDSSDSSE